MERVHQSQIQSPLSTRKFERKIMEKNRRNHLKSLYVKLHSLLPDYISKEVLSVADKIDEAANYINSLQERIEKHKEKKEKLLQKKRAHSSSCNIANGAANTISKLPQFEIHEMGCAMDVIVISGLDKIDIFYGIVRLLHEEGFEVANASFSISGNSTLQVLHGKAGKTTLGVKATRVVRRINEVIYGSSHDCSEQDSRLDLWDFEIESDVWGSENLEKMPIYLKETLVSPIEFN